MEDVSSPQSGSKFRKDSVVSRKSTTRRFSLKLIMANSYSTYTFGALYPLYHNHTSAAIQMPTSCQDVYPKNSGFYLLKPAEDVWRAEVDCLFTEDGGKTCYISFYKQSVSD